MSIPLSARSGPDRHAVHAEDRHGGDTSRHPWWREPLRLAVAVGGGLLAEGVRAVVVQMPLASRFDPTAVASVVGGLMLGPSGAIGVALAFLAAEVADGRPVITSLLNAGTYALVGVLADAAFRAVPNVGRGLRDLRSYLAYLFVVLGGSAVLAVLGSANLFLRAGTVTTFAIGVLYWFASAVTSLLIVGPVVLVPAAGLLRRSPIPVPGDAAATTPADVLHGGAGRFRRDLVLGAAQVVAVSLVVAPLVHLRPQFGGWLALLYLVPILWASSRHGLRGGVLAASASGLAFLAGSTVTELLAPRGLTHDQILGQFAGLVIFALIGAITGAFQEARARAEAALVRSKHELERRHESLEAVASLGDRLQRTLDEGAIARETVATLVRLSRQPVVAVYLLEPDGDALRLVAQQGFDRETVVAGSVLPVDGSLSGLAAASREVCASDDLARDHRLAPAVRERLVREGLTAVISVPLVFEDQSHGAINLVYRDHDAFRHEDHDLLRTVGRTVALALVNARHVARLEHLAFHDPLTGLANREGLHREFEALARRGPTSGVRHALALVDIDRFKEVNDALGHGVGDAVLAALGARLRDLVGDRQIAIARPSGDSFALLMAGIHDDADAVELATTVLAGVSKPLDVDGTTLEIEASAGVALYPDDASDGAELLRCADVAVHYAKSTSRRVVRYEVALDLHTAERLALASELGGAIRGDELALHFQPKVVLRDHRIVGFEALVRWPHPRLGLLPPDRFVPLAEVGELISPLSYWVLERALAQLQRWQRHDPSLTMAVNLSARNLLDGACASRFEEIIRASAVDPTTVEFELTETALLIDPDRAASSLERLSALGARVAVDDFGTGYSSMTFLRRCPIHALKIDRSFVADMLDDPQSRAIVRATVQLAHDLDLAVVAEGIERAPVAAALAELGCDLGQGNLYQPALPAGELERRLGW